MESKWQQSRKLIPVGTQFARLTVISLAESTKNGQRRYLCKCDCGQETTVAAYHLKTGATLSCGCYRRETAGKIGKISHLMPSSAKGIGARGGISKTPEYKAWGNMKSRCYNPHDISYPRYGGKGIQVCERWLHSFEAFFEDVGKRPSSDHSLDRFPIQDGNYEPSNVRWATSKEQQRNIRSNKMLTINGEMKCIAEWAEISGLSHATICARVRAGWKGGDLLQPLLK